MSRKKTARPERPTRGGSYVRNRKTGALDRREAPEPVAPAADAPAATEPGPAEVETNQQKDA